VIFQVIGSPNEED
jgi:hypothetical protein